MVNDYITIDLVNREVTPIVDVVQSDTGRKLHINTGFKYKTGDAAFAYVLKKDGRKVYNSASIDENGVIVVTWSQQMLAVAGEAELQVEITRGAKRVSSFPIQVYVSPSIIDEGAIPSTDEFGALETAINNANNAATSANSAATAANTAANNANTKATAANSAATSANSAAAAANTAANNANTKATAANNAATSANSATTAAIFAATAANAAAEIANSAAAYTRTEEKSFELANLDDFPSDTTKKLIMKATKTGNVITVDVFAKVRDTVGDWGTAFAAVTAFNALPSSWRKSVNSEIYLPTYVGGKLLGQIYIEGTIDTAGVMTATGSWWTRVGVPSTAYEIGAGSEINIHGFWVIKTTAGAPNGIAGLNVNYEAKTFTRLGDATNWTAGADFNALNCFGGRKRCNVADDGTITAYYGDPNYREDGSNGQVMVYQPRFYYKIIPLKLERNTVSGIGFHIRNADYLVSDAPYNGFKLHPAFYDVNGNEVDYILLSAYEGSMYDVSTSSYVNDGTDTDTSIGTGDLLASVAGVKPISGLRKNLNKANAELLANNRGLGWHLETVKAAAANQLLMIIEFGTLNTQTALGKGVTEIADDGGYNCSSLTGSTSSLGNASGAAAETINEIGGTETTYNTNGKVSVSYRGMENPWGNIWKHVQGVNIWGDGHMAGGQPYVANGLSGFNESKRSENYKAVGFTVSNAAGYINAFGYGNPDYDWLLMPSEIGGTSSLPVGDYAYVTANLNEYRLALLGGAWTEGVSAGGFYWALGYGVGFRRRYVGGRLVYVPTANTL